MCWQRCFARRPNVEKMRRRDASVSGRGDGVWVAPDAIDASPNARQTVYGRESSHTGFGFVMSFLFVFIVRGLGGAATLADLSARIRALRRRTVVTLPAGGHHVHLSEPDAVADAFVAWANGGTDVYGALGA